MAWVRDQSGGGVYVSRPDALNTLGAHNKPAEPLRHQCDRCDKLGALEPASRQSGCGGAEVSPMPELVFAHLDLAHPVPARVFGLCSTPEEERSAPTSTTASLCAMVATDGTGAEADVRPVLLRTKSDAALSSAHGTVQLGGATLARILPHSRRTGGGRLLS